MKMDPHKKINQIHRRFCKKYGLDYDVNVGFMCWEPEIFVVVRDRDGHIVEDIRFDYNGHKKT